MQRLGGNRARVAQALGIANSTLYEKLKRYRIEG
jgi:DNA-binding NtrC family response regulator